MLLRNYKPILQMIYTNLRSTSHDPDTCSPQPPPNLHCQTAHFPPPKPPNSNQNSNTSFRTFLEFTPKEKKAATSELIGVYGHSPQITPPNPASTPLPPSSFIFSHLLFFSFPHTSLEIVCTVKSIVGSNPTVCASRKATPYMLPIKRERIFLLCV